MVAAKTRNTANSVNRTMLEKSLIEQAPAGASRAFARDKLTLWRLAFPHRCYGDYPADKRDTLSHRSANDQNWARRQLDNSPGHASEHHFREAVMAAVTDNDQIDRVVPRV